ncbi:MAG TPA: DUF445 domain-containing protein [Gemmatimonadaceae bacterium]|nr:DUF445 domain-containing protein [Gemmatimonadaceae bacterium]
MTDLAVRPPLVVSAPLPPPDEETKRRNLARMKRRASGLLLLATAVWIVTSIFVARYPWLAYVRATAEASMIGGLADWFAVTALFRHPLGIPIPHTAIVAARKDQIGRSLGNFVSRHFLSRDVMAARLASLRVSEHLAKWLAVPENSRTLAHHAATALASGARMLADDDVQTLIDRVLVERIRSTEVAPILGQMLSLLTAGDRHQELLDEAIVLLARTVDQNQELIRDRIEAESPWWVPGVVDDQIHRKIVTGLDNTLADVRDDPNHPLRRRFDEALANFVRKLNESPEVRARAERIKLEILDAAAVRRFSSSIWEDAKAALFRYADAPNAFAPSAIERGLVSLGEAVSRDEALLARIDALIAEVAGHLVDRYQGEVAELIAQTVTSWDPEVTSDRVELAIGKDLQFIRINGTIVGGLAGLAIYVFSRFIGQ